MAKKFKLSLLFLFLIALGYLREFFFININLRYYQILFHPEDNYRSDLIAFLDPLTGMQLYVLKWFLTIFFSLIFFGLGGLLLNIWFNRSNWSAFGLLYISLFFIAGTGYLSLWKLGNPEAGYTIARFFMGLAQSPFTVAFMIPALLLKAQVKS